MPGSHAKLSPSGAERWLECPASIRMEEQLAEQGIVDEDSDYALEGTAAHALGELKARHRILGELTEAQYAKERRAWAKEWKRILDLEDVDVDDMESHTDAYVDFIAERLERVPGSQLLLEQRLPNGVPESGGTADAVILSMIHVEVIDFKYGSGVFVEVHENPQLRLYGVGALENIADLLGEVEDVYITVYQPRMDNVATEEIDPAELREWRDSILPIAEEALGPDARFGPSDEACRWCVASGRCKAQMEEVFGNDFEADIDLLSPEDMAEVQGKVKMIRDWLTAFEVAVLHAAYSEQKEIPGYKVVMSGGRRAVRDPELAIKILTEDHGYELDEVSKTTARGIGDLEKLLGEELFKELLEDPGIVTKGEGKPSLVPESDKRPAIDPNSEAKKEFD